MRTLSLMLLCSGLAACAGSREVSMAPPPAPAAAAAYAIGAGDVVAVKVWQNSELDVSGPVRADGRITLPLVGDVEAAGRAPEQVADEIEKALATYVKEPRVSVIVTEARSDEYASRVRVTGAVREPVSLPYKPGMTVLDAVLAAGGPTEYAAADRAALHRRGNGAGSATRYALALESMLEDGEMDSNYPVQPGDVITVPQRNF